MAEPGNDLQAIAAAIDRLAEVVEEGLSPTMVPSRFERLVQERDDARAAVQRLAEGQASLARENAALSHELAAVRGLAKPAEPEISEPATPETIEGGTIGYWHALAKILQKRMRQTESSDLPRLTEDSIAWRAACAALAPHAQPGENTAGTLARILLWHGPHRSELVGNVAAHSLTGEGVVETFKRLLAELEQLRPAAATAKMSQADFDEAVAAAHAEERERAARIVMGTSLWSNSLHTVAVKIRGEGEHG